MNSTVPTGPLEEFELEHDLAAIGCRQMDIDHLDGGEFLERPVQRRV